MVNNNNSNENGNFENSAFHPQSDEIKSFSLPLAEKDPLIYASIKAEGQRQKDVIELIASENISSAAVMEAQGSVLTNKYAEGYPKKRYYAGCEFVDEVEELAISRLKRLYGVEYCNVQPHSGSQANQAVFLALLKPGDKILGLSLSSGGHLTHGSPVNLSGKWFNSIFYEVDPKTGLIDYENVRQIALKEKPQMIIAGGSAYPRIIDFKKFREIADEVGAYYLVDMAHFSGLVAGGAHPSPVEHADVVTSTTHKTLRGPRGGIILSNNSKLYKKLNSGIFPGLQGGPLMHVIAAKAVAFGEALQDEFKVYASRVVKNARALSNTLIKRGYDIFTGGTDTHLALLDLRSKGLKGNAAEQALERAHICCNKNAIPFDTEKPTVTSGIRIGTPVGTTRGFTEPVFQEIGNLIADILDGLAECSSAEENKEIEDLVKIKALSICHRFPILA